MRTIACLGPSTGTPTRLDYQSMEEIGQLLGSAGCTIATGGFSGSGMEAPAKGCAKAGGNCVGYVMLGIPANQYVTEVIDCSTINNQTLSPELQYGVRLGMLLSADAFILLGSGGVGTLVELMAIINLNRKLWQGNPKRLAILDVSMSQVIRETIDMLTIATTGRTETLITTSVTEAANWVL